MNGKKRTELLAQVLRLMRQCGSQTITNELFRVGYNLLYNYKDLKPAEVVADLERLAGEVVKHAHN